MKQILFGISILLAANHAQGFVRNEKAHSNSCPVVFRATVSDIEDFEAPFVSVRNSLVKVKVHMDVEQVLNGEVSQKVSIDVLKYGPHKFKKGEKVEIGLRDKWICSVKK